MKKHRPEDLGSMGESFFKTLCKDIGLVANSSDDDKGGWDYEVEHPADNSINFSNHSYPVYRVQVKSTATKKNQVKVTYGNLLKLIRYGGASFIVFFSYSKSIHPDKAFLLHVDENFSKTVLKEVRKKQIKDLKFPLNKREKIVKFDSSSEINPLTGTGLSKAIKKALGPDYLKYVERKISYLAKLEKEGGRREFNITLKSESDIRAMANCFLGYNEQFKVDSQEYYAPFGIRDNTPRSSVKDHVTTVSPIKENLKEVKVYVKNSQFGKQFEFCGLIYIVPIQLPNEVAKMRIKTTLFDFIFDPNTRGISFEARDLESEDIKVEFKELYNYFCVLNGAFNSKDTYIKLKSSDGDSPPEVCLGVPKVNLPNNFPTIFTAIESTYKKACDLNIERETISTQKIWQRLGSFHLFSIVGKKYEPEYSMEFESSGNNVQDINVVLFNSHIEFEKVILLSFVAFYGSIEKVRENVLLGHFHKSELMGEYVLESSIELDSLMEKESKLYEKKLTKMGLNVL